MCHSSSSVDKLHTSFCDLCCTGLTQIGKEYKETLKVCFSSTGWPVWPSNIAFVMVVQVNPKGGHLLIRTFIYF